MQMRLDLRRSAHRSDPLHAALRAAAEGARTWLRGGVNDPAGVDQGTDGQPLTDREQRGDLLGDQGGEVVLEAGQHPGHLRVEEPVCCRGGHARRLSAPGPGRSGLAGSPETSRVWRSAGTNRTDVEGDLWPSPCSTT